ncbi:MAG: winged helix-turn-helix transcriptional regulator [Bacteroidetes bacterium]|nr:winged helix-turn-helix transcriptional regulator [Bacteroidota bacterium]
MQAKALADIRAFNRYYTSILGLLDQHLLNSPFSLPEARVLYELSQREGIPASGIIESLRMDKGYLSRMLEQFSGQKLIVRKKSEADGRQMHIYLTDKGRKEFEKLNRASDQQLRELFDLLPAADLDRLVQHMAGITMIIQKAQAAKEK